LLKALSVAPKQLYLRTLSPSSIKQPIEPTYNRENLKRAHCGLCNQKFQSEELSSKTSLSGEMFEEISNEHRLESNALAQGIISG